MEASSIGQLIIMRVMDRPKLNNRHNMTNYLPSHTLYASQ